MLPRRRLAGPAMAGLVAVLIACAGVLLPIEPTGRQRVSPIAKPGDRVGTEACLACHDSFAGHWVRSEFHADCEACHGSGQRHTLTARATDIRFPANADCMACHEGRGDALIGWTRSPHRRADLLCSDCHDTHNRAIHNLRAAPVAQRATLPNASDSTRLCASCHPEVAASLALPSHHAVREGMLDCNDCHAPHGDQRFTLGARTESCTVCHQEQRGPWIYEHAPVAEDCGYCHLPHGSSAEALLETTQPGACIGCHTVAFAGAVHDPWAFVTRCTDCHGAIHGSYADPHLRR